MNLLEHYIKDVKKEELVVNPKTGNEYYQVTVVVDCYGHKEEMQRLFTVSEWGKAKADGYFMS